MSSEAFDIIRLVLIVVAVVLRLVLMPIYLQAYLNLAYDRLEEQKKEAGRITNIDLQKKVCGRFMLVCTNICICVCKRTIAYQIMPISLFSTKQVASIFYYLCVVTLQYVAPILMCLYFALMYKTLGGYNWTDLLTLPNNGTEKCAAPTVAPVQVTPLVDPDFEIFTDEQFDTLDKSILASAKELQLSFHGLKAVSITNSNFVFQVYANHSH